MIWYAWLLVAAGLAVPWIMIRWLSKEDVELMKDPAKKPVLVVDVPKDATDAELEAFFFRQNYMEAGLMELGVLLGFVLAWAALNL